MFSSEPDSVLLQLADRYAVAAPVSGDPELQPPSSSQTEPPDTDDHTGDDQSELRDNFPALNVEDESPTSSAEWSQAGEHPGTSPQHTEEFAGGTSQQNCATELLKTPFGLDSTAQFPAHSTAPSTSSVLQAVTISGETGGSWACPPESEQSGASSIEQDTATPQDHTDRPQVTTRQKIRRR